jgi:hypothetical protein
MNQRFQNEEIRRVAEQYAPDELYRAICTIGPQLESELPEFGLCPEECFAETLELLSLIAEKGEDILSEVDNIWLRKFNEYRRVDRHVNEVEIRKAVGIVFGFCILAIDSCHHPFYRRTLSERLMQVIADHQFDGWAATLERIFSVPLPEGWFDAFLDENLEESDNLPQLTGVPKLTTAAEKFSKIVAPFGFVELSLVKALNAKQQAELIELIVKDACYAAAMLKYLGYYDRLREVYQKKSNEDIISHCAKAVGCASSTFKKYYYSMSSKDPYSTYERHNSQAFFDNGQINADYKRIKDSK